MKKISNEVLTDKGGNYLVVTTSPKYFEKSFAFACAKAEVHDAHVIVAYIIDQQQHSTWSAVEDKIIEKLRQDAEKDLYQNFLVNVDNIKNTPCVIISIGNKNDEVIKIINDPDLDVRRIIVSCDVEGASQGSLAHYLTSKGLAKFSIPLVMIPG